MFVCCVLNVESAVAMSDEQRVPRNSDALPTESLSNGSDWNRSSSLGLTTNGNNTSDSLSQDDDLGQCF